MTKIVITSQSPIKVDAVKSVFKDFYEDVEYVCLKVASNVPEQPCNDQTLAGAVNRVNNAKKIEPHADLYVSVESGLFEQSGDHYDHAIAYIITKDGIEGTSMSAGVRMPEYYVSEARTRGFSTTTPGMIMMEDHFIKHDGDPHIELVGTKRQVFVEEALRGALTNLMKQTHQP